MLQILNKVSHIHSMIDSAISAAAPESPTPFSRRSSMRTAATPESPQDFFRRSSMGVAAAPESPKDFSRRSSMGSARNLSSQPSTVTSASTPYLVFVSSGSARWPRQPEKQFGGLQGTDVVT